MGVADVVNRLRSAWAKDKTQQGVDIAKGGIAPVPTSSNYDLLQSYGMEALSEYLRMDHDLLTRFVDYEEMDDYPELSSAVDIFADDATQTDSQLNRVVWVESKDRTLADNLNDMYQKRLRLDEEGWEIVRTLAKYGNDYEELLVNRDGVVGLNYLPPATMRRIEGPRGDLYGFIQDFKGKTGFTPGDFKLLQTSRSSSTNDGMNVALEDWEVVHFRLRGKTRRSVYGHSVLEPARWIWKRLLLLEDAALIYRLQRAPERYAFYIDVGDMPPAEALAYVNRVRQQMKKQKFFNPSTGKMDMRHNPMAQDEDFFIPSRKGVDGTRVETIGAPSWQAMDDIQYFQDKLFAALKIPKAYLGKDEGTVKAVLSQEDVRFARTVLRVQREMRNGLAKIARVHLAAQGLDPHAADFEVRMTVPSSIFELAQLEVRNARADLAGRMKEFVSLHWLLRNVFGIAEEDIESIMKERTEDMERDGMTQNRVQAMGQQMMMQSGMGGGEEQQPQFQPDENLGDGKPPGVEGVATGNRNMVMEARRRKLIRAGMPPITERELFAGDRNAEKRAEAKLEEVLKTDRRLALRLNEVAGMVRELAASRRR